MTRRERIVKIVFPIFVLAAAVIGMLYVFNAMLVKLTGGK